MQVAYQRTRGTWSGAELPICPGRGWPSRRTASHVSESSQDGQSHPASHPRDTSNTCLSMDEVLCGCSYVALLWRQITWQYLTRSVAWPWQYNFILFFMLKSPIHSSDTEYLLHHPCAKHCCRDKGSGRIIFTRSVYGRSKNMLEEQGFCLAHSPITWKGKLALGRCLMYFFI